jgi:hypothetical protein
MGALIQGVPQWVGWLGWVAVLIGFLFQRRALVTQEARSETSVKGNHNQVTNTTTQTVMEAGGGGDSALAQWGSWASIVGLILTLLPLVKAWLSASA